MGPSAIPDRRPRAPGPPEARARGALVQGRVSVWIGLLAAACYSVSALPEAKADAAEYFAALQAGDVDRALSLHHPAIYAETPREEWPALLAQLHARLGDLQDTRLVERKAFFGIKSAGIGTYLTLSYAVRYTRATTGETLVLFQSSGGERPRIVSHRLDSTTFEEDAGPGGG